jgi:hypothetical protein
MDSTWSMPLHEYRFNPDRSPQNNGLKFKRKSILLAAGLPANHRGGYDEETTQGRHPPTYCVLHATSTSSPASRHWLQTGFQTSLRLASTLRSSLPTFVAETC